ncbi:S26 family signal peptidase [Microtetraspora sp. AC03309]|uniref:S26 family signal peptidase n=1 Tax=Microtetraspora sp. AC03309 TaxID=2779376 RepID=UPI001E414EC6|nr:S26 family signal peptidase [Microtetraspora sp. AC03309]MCC5577546.1 S26 family signal peptidase [Microtetraspora sp. AC03309]
MKLALPAAGILLAVGLLALWARRGFLATTVRGTSMEPTLRPGDRLLVRRTKRVRAGQIVVFLYSGGPHTEEPVPERDRTLLIKRAVAVPGDQVPVEWEHPDVHEVAGTVVPRGALVVLGDNRATSWDSRHYGLVRHDRFVGVVIRRLPGREPSEGDTAHGAMARLRPDHLAAREQ